MSKPKRFSFPVNDSDFRISSYSDPGGIIKTCVAVAKTPDGIAVRDTKNENGETLFFRHDEWDAFVSGVRNGEF